ncbi:MAG TPA: hypothetical protein PKV13_02530 [Propionicimonas sp.]|nr:hypothetical protein [Propionicimonas sp.]HRA05479.1 hypothetical protein [Propionicimonas sp.]
MDQLFAALDASWRVLLVGLVLGAGLPTVYAFGIRALAWGTGGDAQLSNAGEPAKPRLLGRVVAYLLFAFVVLSVVLGISYIVAHGFGMTITFDGIMPVFTSK